MRSGLENDYSNRLHKEDWEVRPIGNDIARKLIRNFHYAKGSANTAVYTHGLFAKGEFWDENCMGVAWWMPPTKSCGMNTYPENPQGVLALSRLVVDPGVPKNACTFLLSRSIRLIDRKRWPCLLTYADTRLGHQGTIYKAGGWKYVGMTKPETAYLVNGVMRCKKSAANTRTHSEMLSLGAVDAGRFAKHKFVLLPHRKSNKHQFSTHES